MYKLSFYTSLFLRLKYIFPIVYFFYAQCLTVTAALWHSILFIHLLMNYSSAWEGIFRNMFPENDLSSIISAIRQLKFLLSKIDVQI